MLFLGPLFAACSRGCGEEELPGFLTERFSPLPPERQAASCKCLSLCNSLFSCFSEPDQILPTRLSPGPTLIFVSEEGSFLPWGKCSSPESIFALAF